MAIKPLYQQAERREKSNFYFKIRKIAENKVEIRSMFEPVKLFFSLRLWPKWHFSYLQFCMEYTVISSNKNKLF